MISIIISSYQDNYYTALEKNISETIGLTYEIIKINNKGTMGICEAYNKGASKTQYDYLLFIHEDIIFHTQNWGELLIKHLDKKNVGVLGIAGSNYVPKSPIGWHLPDNRYNFYNYIQNDRSKLSPKLLSNIKHTQQVFALDGVLMAVKKAIYNEFLFDEAVKGFHGYDLDFSLRVASKYYNYVITDVLIEHYSIGKANEDWLANNIFIKNKKQKTFEQVYDNEVEKLSFLLFLNKFFIYNKINVKNLFFTFWFLSLRLYIKSFYEISKSYLYYYFKDKK